MFFFPFWKRYKAKVGLQLLKWKIMQIYIKEDICKLGWDTITGLDHTRGGCLCRWGPEQRQRKDRGQQDAAPWLRPPPGARADMDRDRGTCVQPPQLSIGRERRRRPDSPGSSSAPSHLPWNQHSFLLAPIGPPPPPAEAARFPWKQSSSRSTACCSSRWLRQKRQAAYCKWYHAMGY